MNRQALTRARQAVSLGIVSVVVIVLILIAGFGIFIDTTFHASSTTSVTTVGTRHVQCQTSGVSGTSPVNSTTTAILFFNGMPNSFKVASHLFTEPFKGIVNYTLVLSVAYSGVSQNATFGWAPPGPLGGPCGEVLPSPSSAVLFGGNLSLNWLLYSSELYLNITTAQVASVSS